MPRHGILLVLSLSYALSLVDRQILVIVQESIKRDLHLSDGQLGLLTGFSFALFYAVLGVPIGSFADRSNRRDLVALSIIAWSAMTALVGTAQTYIHLLLLRIGVASGEAGITPSCCSMITDLYPPRNRAAAMSFYTIGAQLGLLVGFLAGSRLEQQVGWRMTFVLAGLPGIFLGIAFKLFIKEPRRLEQAGTPMPFREGVRHLAMHRTIRLLAIAVPLSGLVSYAPMVWTVSYLTRVHHLPLVQVGTWLAFEFGIGGLLGSFGTGLLSDRLARRDIRWYLWISAINTTILAVSLSFALTAADGKSALLFFAVPFALGSSYAGVGLSLVNTIAGPRFRATTSALYLLVANVFGMGLGTWVIGMLSDLFHPAFGQSSIQYALLAVLPPAAVIAAILYLRAARSLSEDLAGNQTWSTAGGQTREAPGPRLSRRRMT